MYVKSLGYGTATVIETNGATDTFAVKWELKMLNCLGLSDLIVQCNPEPSLLKWAESVNSTRQERTVIRSSPRRSHQSNGSVENYQKQLQGQVRTMLAALQDRTQYRPTTDSALMKWIRHAAWLIPRFRGTMCSSVEQWAVRTEASCWNSVNLCLLTFQRWEEDLGIPRSSWLTDGNPPCGWARATSRTSTLVRTDEGVVHARSVRRLAEHSWSEENLRAVVDTPQKWKSTTVDIPGASSSGRGETRTETQEKMFVKKRLMMKSPQRPATHVTPPDDPVKRRPLKKTDPKSDDVLMPVEIEDSDQLNTVNTLLNDETGEEAMPWSDESEKRKILTVLDDPKEVEKGRHK